MEKEMPPSGASLVSDPPPSTALIPHPTSTTSSSSSSTSKPAPRSFKSSLPLLPPSLLNHTSLNTYLSSCSLPTNYNFEIHKTIHRIRTVHAHTIALQMPEGLLIYACVISDILQRFTYEGTEEEDKSLEVVVMGDVTYGACCIDDYTAVALGCELLIHYGHSCLVPIDQCSIPMLYIFVDISINLSHVYSTILTNFPPSSHSHLVLAGTIQFTSAIQHLASMLLPHYPHLLVPQAKPLSKGEILGCTSPTFPSSYTTLLFIADGRFHLESLLIHNPQLKQAYKYDPYSLKLTRERYAHEEMRKMRWEEIEKAKRVEAKRWGLIVGTLGRQGGNEALIKRMIELLTRAGKEYTLICLSEIYPSKLDLFSSSVDVFIQLSCPRLSIDWGYAFSRPLLSTYEAEVALQTSEWKEVYPMDYYSEEGGTWSNYEERERKKKEEKEERRKRREEEGEKENGGKGKRLLPHQRLKLKAKEKERKAKLVVAYETDPVTSSTEVSNQSVPVSTVVHPS